MVLAPNLEGIIIIHDISFSPPCLCCQKRNMIQSKRIWVGSSVPGHTHYLHPPLVAFSFLPQILFGLQKLLVIQHNQQPSPLTNHSYLLSTWNFFNYQSLYSREEPKNMYIILQKVLGSLQLEGSLLYKMILRKMMVKVSYRAPLGDAMLLAIWIKQE